ncbi:MAG: cytochrome c [Bacteroidia bacterium]|nr:cytochrome c [Bacteroidia bacterium]
MKKLLSFLFIAALIASCGGDKGSTSDNKKPTVVKPKTDKGIGETKSVTLNDPLDEGMIENGKAIYQLKCAACHKLSAKRVVGPGWEGLSKKRKPEWIMNMITNVDVMLDKDPTAQKLLEECLTRMPNQNVSVDEARDILEFILKNDLDRGVQ